MLIQPDYEKIRPSIKGWNIIRMEHKELIPEKLEVSDDLYGKINGLINEFSLHDDINELIWLAHWFQGYKINPSIEAAVKLEYEMLKEAYVLSAFFKKNKGIEKIKILTNEKGEIAITSPLLINAIYNSLNEIQKTKIESYNISKFLVTKFLDGRSPQKHQRIRDGNALVTLDYLERNCTKIPHLRKCLFIGKFLQILGFQYPSRGKGAEDNYTLDKKLQDAVSKAIIRAKKDLTLLN